MRGACGGNSRDKFSALNIILMCKHKNRKMRKTVTEKLGNFVAGINIQFRSFALVFQPNEVRHESHTFAIQIILVTQKV